MFPVDRLRMNSIYGDSGGQAEFGPPNFNGGMDIGSILPGILQHLSEENDKDRQFKLHMLDRSSQQNQPQLQNIAREAKEPIKEEKKTYLPPTYNGMPASDFFNLQEKKREFDEGNSLKTQQFGLKKEDTTADNQLGKDKLNEKSKNDTARTDIAKQRADIYKFKAEHPNVQIIRTKGGTVQIYDPADKTTHDTGIDSGTLSDEDEINLKNGKKLEEQDNQSTNRLAEISARLKGQQEIANSNNKSKEEIANTKPGFYQGQFFRNPKDTTGDVNPDRTLPPAKDTVLPKDTKVPDGRVIVYDKNGKAFHLPAEQLDEAIKQGYFKDKPKVGG